MNLSIKSLGASIGRALGIYPRPALPARYSDGWQAGTPLDATKASDALSDSALRRGLEIIDRPAYRVDADAGRRWRVRGGFAGDRPSRLETCGQRYACSTGNGWLSRAHAREGFECIQASAGICRAGCARQASLHPNYGKTELDIQTDAHLQCRNYFSPFVGDALLESYAESASAIMATSSIFRQLQGNGSHAEVLLEHRPSAIGQRRWPTLRKAYEAADCYRLRARPAVYCHFERRH